MFQNKTILITGSAGFIGSNLMKRLLIEANNCTLVGFDNCNDYYDVSLKEYRLKELENIDAYIKGYREEKYIFFRYFLTDEKIKLIQDINNTKLKIYSKEGKVPAKPEDYKTFEKTYPELVLKFKDYGKILEYDKIDYLKVYESNEEEEKKKNSKIYDVRMLYRFMELKMNEIQGKEYFGLTENTDYSNIKGAADVLFTAFERIEWTDKIKKQLIIQDETNDLFYEANRVGTISSKKKTMI